MVLDPVKVGEMAQAYCAAWRSMSPQAVASFFAADGQITINRGETSKGRAAIAEMAAGFYADVPDMVVHCDGARTAGSHALLLWTFEGHHGQTAKPVSIRGWEEWELDADLKISASLGWFDADEYARQIAEGV